MGQRKYLLVVVDYFTKWIEAEVVTSITAAEVQKLIWRNIIHFSIPRAMIFGNGLPSNTVKVTEYLNSMGHQAWLTAVMHPQTNGQDKAVDKVILYVL